MLQLRVCFPSSLLTTRFGVAFATLLLFVSELEVSGFSIFFEGDVLNKVYTGFAFFVFDRVATRVPFLSF